MFEKQLIKNKNVIKFHKKLLQIYVMVVSLDHYIIPSLITKR